MSADRYRIILAFDPENDDYVARVPELDLEARGPSRADAVSEVEGAVEQRIAGAAEDKATLPEPIDTTSPSGQVTITLGGPLHKELLHHARASRMNAEALAAQLLARAIGALDGGRPGRRPQPDRDRDRDREREVREEGNGAEMRDSNRPQRRDDRDDDRGNRGRRKREGYRPELEDKANFLEYLRGLEKGGPQGGGRGRR